MTSLLCFTAKVHREEIFEDNPKERHDGRNVVPPLVCRQVPESFKPPVEIYFFNTFDCTYIANATAVPDRQGSIGHFLPVVFIDKNKKRLALL